MENDNVGKCGHARCAGGNGCLQKCEPMNGHGYRKDEMNPQICSSALGEDTGYCNECGAEPEEVKCI